MNKTLKKMSCQKHNYYNFNIEKGAYVQPVKLMHRITLITENYN